jgi:alcohol dehydrogenase
MSIPTSSNSIAPFEFSPMPAIHFGWGIRQQFIEFLIKNFSKKIVVITGKTLAKQGYFGHELLNKLYAQNIPVQHFIVSGEPSPEQVDEIVQQCHINTQAVIGLGGGSVLDASKAIAGLIPSQTSVMDYLEGVGLGKSFNVNTCPFIAVPTTAGTGSETTKNAVLSKLGQFKKSFRDDKLLAKHVWLDPELLKTCPKETLYATGLDAFTQLLESYTTLKSNPMTDALAWQGMTLFQGAFKKVDSPNESIQQEGYSNLMLAASLSGITLANAGLGAVHGLAGPIGAFFKAPHGIVCAKLLAPITQLNIETLLTSHTDNSTQYLEKYRQISQLLSSNQVKTSNSKLSNLIEILHEMTQKYAPNGLAQYQMTPNNLTNVIENCRSGSMLGNPVQLTDQQLLNALKQAI